jgi:hypothetical protein
VATTQQADAFVKQQTASTADGTAAVSDDATSAAETVEYSSTDAKRHKLEQAAAAAAAVAKATAVAAKAAAAELAEYCKSLAAAQQTELTEPSPGIYMY